MIGFENSDRYIYKIEIEKIFIKIASRRGAAAASRLHRAEIGDNVWVINVK